MEIKLRILKLGDEIWKKMNLKLNKKLIKERSH